MHKALPRRYLSGLVCPSLPLSSNLSTLSTAISIVVPYQFCYLKSCYRLLAANMSGTQSDVFYEFMDLPVELRHMVYNLAIYADGHMHPDPATVVVRLESPHFDTNGQMIDCGNIDPHGCNPSLAYDRDVSSCINRTIAHDRTAKRVNPRTAYIANRPIQNLFGASGAVADEAVHLLPRYGRYFFNSTDALSAFLRDFPAQLHLIEEVDLTGFGGSNNQALMQLSHCPNLRRLTLRCRAVTHNPIDGQGVEALMTAIHGLENVSFKRLLDFDQDGFFTGYSTHPSVTNNDPLARQIIAALTQPVLTNPPDTLNPPVHNTARHPWNPRHIMYL